MTAAIGWFGGDGEALAAFLPPELEAVSAGESTPPRDLPPQQTPDDEPFVVAFSPSNAAGVGTGASATTTGSHAVGLSHELCGDRLADLSRLYVARDRIRPHRGFLPEILRPPRS